MSLEQFSAKEHQKVLDAEAKYGDAFINAYNATILVSNLMMWPISCRVGWRGGGRPPLVCGRSWPGKPQDWRR
jgi:hypothetical protein